MQNGDISRKDLLGRIPGEEREKIFGRLMCMEVCALLIDYYRTNREYTIFHPRSRFASVSSLSKNVSSLSLHRMPMRALVTYPLGGTNTSL